MSSDAPLPSSLHAICERLARLTATALEVPTAGIVLRRGDTWHAVYAGGGQRSPGPGRTFAAQVDERGERVVLEDLTADARFWDHPWVQGEGGVHFFAGVPMEGHQGVVAVWDAASRSLEPHEADLLDELAAFAGDEIAQWTAHQAETGFVERSPDPMCVISAKGKLVTVNRAFEEALGYSVADVIQRPYVELVHPDERAATRAMVQRAVEGEEVSPFVHRVQHRSGAYRWFEWGSIVCEAGHLCAAVRDVSARKEEERRLAAQHATASALAESESLAEATPRILQAICENLSWDWGELWMPADPADHLEIVEIWHDASIDLPRFEAATHRTTFRPAEGLPGTVWQSGAPKWIADVTDHDNFVRVKAAEEVGMHGALAFPIRLGETTLGVMAFFSHDIREPDEQLVQMLDLVGNQIGQFVERRQAEHALETKAERLAQAQDIANMGSWTYDLDTGEMTWSDQMYRVYGVDPDDFTPTLESIFERIHKSERAKVEEALESVREEGGSCSVEFRIRHPVDGRERWIRSQAETTNNASGASRRLVGTAMDITDRKRAEHQLRRQIKLEHLVAEFSTRFIGAPSHEIDDLINEALCRIGQFVGADRCRIVQREDESAVLNNTHEWSAEGIRPQHDDFQGVTQATFAWAWTRLQENRPVLIPTVNELPDAAKAMRDFLLDLDIRSCLLVPLRREGTLQGFTAFCKTSADFPWSEDTVTLLRMMTDVCVTALQCRHAEEQLFQIRQAVESASDAIGIADTSGQSMYHNPAFEQLFGYTPEALNDAGGPAALFADAATGEHILETVRDGRSWRGEVKLESRDGAQHQISLRASPVLDQQGEIIGLLGIHTDITERMQIKEALRETEKLAATGRMAAGIAHEINNPLAGIKNAFQIVKRALPEDFEYDQFAERIDREIDRISTIVRQMYSLYKPDREAAAPFSVREVVENAAMVLRPAAREQRVSLDPTVEPDDDIAVLPEGGVNQILYNLISNAIEATPEGGTVRVEGDVTEKSLKLRVKDEGAGIPEDIQSRIFEPFFSQRDHMHSAKDGMGLGLSISKVLTESMGGQLSWTARASGGTTFTLALPRELPGMDERLSSTGVR